LLKETIKEGVKLFLILELFKEVLWELWLLIVHNTVFKVKKYRGQIQPPYPAGVVSFGSAPLRLTSLHLLVVLTRIQLRIILFTQRIKYYRAFFVRLSLSGWVWED